MQKRNPYADCGLVIAISVLIIMIVKCCIFNVTWVAILWIVLSLIYCFLSYKYDSESKLIKNITTGFLSISAVTLIFFTVFDHKDQPTMNAFEGAKKDTIDEEEFIVQDDPVIKQLIADTTSVADTIIATADTLIPEAVDPSTPAPTEESTEEMPAPATTEEEPIY